MSSSQVLAWLAAASVAGAVYADQIILAPSHDTSIYQSSGTVSNGAGEHLFSGRTQTAGLRRALLRFDPSQIPAGSTITAATLDLTLTLTVGVDGEGALHRVTESWGEGTSDAGSPGGNGIAATAGDATWTHRVFPDVAWSTDGGAFESTASGVTAITTAPGLKTFASSAGMVSDVQAWLDQPSINFGWVLLCDEPITGNARRFASREAAASTRPRLTVTFTPPAPPCPADFNQSGSITVQDIFDFLIAYFANDPQADFNGVGGITVQDIFDYLAAYFVGCP